jgi:DNA-binding IclR family transcriptional regulator
MSLKLLVKAFSLLEASSDAEAGRPLAELAAEVGLPKPTAHRILTTMVALGYMERCSPGCYRHSPSLKNLADPLYQQHIVRVADSEIRELHRKTRETINLGILRSGKIVYLSVLESPQPLRRIVNPSMTDPFASTALGRAIVGFLPADRQKILFTNLPLEKRTPYTIVEPAALRKLMEKVREQGYAVEENETDLGVMCLGAPILDNRGQAIAAISLSAPMVRMEDGIRESWIGELRATASRISDRWVRETSNRR